MTMDSEYSKQYNDFQHELEEAKLRLISLNENIRRIVGRTANARSEKTKLSDLKRSEPGRKCSDVPKPKKRVYEQKSVFNRLSVPAFKNKSDEQEPRPRVTSRIIRELPTRQEIVAAQCNDSESRARNKRMFGSLLGTLHKFTQEESRLKQKEEKKAQIEKKLEEQEIQEKEILKKEREHLFMDRKRKQIEIKKLELKVNRLKDFETAEATSNFLKHHIRTKTKPHIYFLPKLMTKNTEQILLDSRATLQILSNKQRKLLNKDLADIENCLKDTDLDTEENPESVETNFEKNIQHGDEKNVFCEERIKDCDIKNLKRKLEKDLDTKENLSEPVVSSSVVVVKNEQID